MCITRTCSSSTTPWVERLKMKTVVTCIKSCQTFSNIFFFGKVETVNLMWLAEWRTEPIRILIPRGWLALIFFLKSPHVPRHPGGKTATFSKISQASVALWVVVCRWWPGWANWMLQTLSTWIIMLVCLSLFLFYFIFVLFLLTCCCCCCCCCCCHCCCCCCRRRRRRRRRCCFSFLTSFVHSRQNGHTQSIEPYVTFQHVSGGASCNLIFIFYTWLLFCNSS